MLALDPDLQLRYERIAGPADRPVLVFLHEGLGGIGPWKDFPARLCAAAGCPGLVYERTGHGGSGPLRKARTIHYLHDLALRELPAVLDALVPEGPFLLVGHSDGATIALLHAAERSPRLLGVVSLAAHVFVEDVTVRGVAEAAEAYAQGKLAGLARYHGDKTAALFAAWAETWLAPWFRSWNVEYALPAIRCPLLVVQGEDDQYATVAQVEAIASQVGGPVETALLPDCAHSPHKEAAEPTLALASAFIARLAEGGPTP